MATAAELTGRKIAVAESPSDRQFERDTMAAIMHRIGTGLMALGQKVLVALIIFLIGRKVISMIEKMLSRSMEHAGMDVGVTRFLRALTQFVMNVFLLFMIAGSLRMPRLQGGSGGRSALELLAPAESWKLCGRLRFHQKPFRWDFRRPGRKGFDGRAGFTTILTTIIKQLPSRMGTLSNSTVTNVTAMDKRMLELKVGIAYEADIRRQSSVRARLPGTSDGEEGRGHQGICGQPGRQQRGAWYPGLGRDVRLLAD